MVFVCSTHYYRVVLRRFEERLDEGGVFNYDPCNPKKVIDFNPSRSKCSVLKRAGPLDEMVFGGDPAPPKKVIDFNPSRTKCSVSKKSVQ